MAILRQRKIETAMDVIAAGENGHVGISGLGPGKWSLLWEWAWTALSMADRIDFAQGLVDIDPDTQFDAWLASMPSDHPCEPFRRMVMGEADARNVAPASMASFRQHLIEAMRSEVDQNAVRVMGLLMGGADEATSRRIRELFAEDRRQREEFEKEQAAVAKALNDEYDRQGRLWRRNMVLFALVGVMAVGIFCASLSGG